MSQLKNLVSEWKYKDKYVCELHNGGSAWGGFSGYVGVPKGHPIWGLHYDDVMKKVPSIGKRLQLTYSTEDKDPEDGLWLVGFHDSDLRDVKFEEGTHIYKDYVSPGHRKVIKMTKWLAKKIEEAENKINASD